MKTNTEVEDGRKEEKGIICKEMRMEPKIYYEGREVT
jgi:hypothetical protein